MNSEAMDGGSHIKFDTTPQTANVPGNLQYITATIMQGVRLPTISTQGVGVALNHTQDISIPINHFNLTQVTNERIGATTSCRGLGRRRVLPVPSIVTNDGPPHASAAYPENTHEERTTGVGFLDVRLPPLRIVHNASCDAQLFRSQYSNTSLMQGVRMQVPTTNAPTDVTTNHPFETQSHSNDSLGLDTLSNLAKVHSPEAMEVGNTVCYTHPAGSEKPFPDTFPLKTSGFWTHMQRDLDS